MSKYLIINVIATFVLVFIYPAICLAGIMGIAGNQDNTIPFVMRLFYYFTLAYPIFFIVGWVGFFKKNLWLSLSPYYHIIISIVLFFIVYFLEN